MLSGRPRTTTTDMPRIMPETRRCRLLNTRHRQPPRSDQNANNQAATPRTKIHPGAGVESPRFINLSSLSIHYADLYRTRR